MFIYTADPAILKKLSKAKHNKRLTFGKTYGIASSNPSYYSEVLAVLCLYETCKVVSLTKLEMVPIGNTALHSSLFKEEVYSCRLSTN